MATAESSVLSDLVKTAPADKAPEEILSEAGITPDSCDDYEDVLRETKDILKGRFHVNGTSLARHKADTWSRSDYIEALKTLRDELAKDGKSLTSMSYQEAARGGAYPSLSRVAQIFGSWNQALDQAGIAANRGGKKSGRKILWTESELLDFVIACAQSVTDSDNPNDWHSLSSRAYTAWRTENLSPTAKGEWNPQIPSSAWLRTQLGRWTEIRTKAIQQALHQKAAA